jgi:hypothetical protein
LAAVQKNGLALQFVKEQTPEVCLAAVKQNGLVLCHVKKKTPEVYLAAFGSRPKEWIGFTIYQKTNA